MIRRLILSPQQASALLLCSASFALLGATIGCSSKNYVRSQTAPIVANVNELDAQTAATHRAIADTDERATRGIHGAMTAANNADQHALAAGTAADQANAAAQDAVNHVDSLAGVVANLDQYKQLQDVSVTFAFNKSILSPSDKRELDALASNLTGTKGYILQLTGGTDAVGAADYNYKLSERRADAVVSYLAAKYNVPPRKFYLVGIGKDQPVASDKTAKGRAENRRVQVLLLSNMTQVSQGSAPAAANQATQ